MKVPHTAQSERFFDNPDNYLRSNAVITFRRSLVHELLGDVSGLRIVDVGCGDGTLSLQYAPSAAHLALVDFSAGMLQAARANVPATFASKVSLHRLNVDDESLMSAGVADVVICVGVFAHVAEPELAMARVASLVAPGGRLVLQISDADRWAGKFLYGLSRLAARSRRYSLSRTGCDDVVRWADANGLSLAAATPYPISLPGYRRLPTWLQERMLVTLHRVPQFAPLRTEVLLLFEREGPAPADGSAARVAPHEALG